MKKLTKVLAILIAATMVITTGCAAKEAAAPAATEAAKEAAGAADAGAAKADGKYTVGISLLYRQDEYYKDLEATFVNTAEKYNFDLNIQDANLDLATQIGHIEDFVTMGVDAIAFAPVDAAGVVPAVEEALGKGIPVFVFDSKIDSDAPTCQVIFDLYNDGAIMGEWALDYIEKEMGGKATIAILDFPAEPNGSVIRSNGFQETIEAAGNPNIQVVTRQDGQASRTGSMEMMENILTGHPDVDMVFGINFDTCAGAKAACEAQGKKDVAIVGLGWGIEAFEALENNDPYYKAWFVPAPPVLAENTFEVISKYLNGGEVSKDFEGQSFIVDASNIKDYDWRSIVALRNE